MPVESNTDITYHGLINRGSKSIPLISSLNSMIDLNTSQLEQIEYYVNATLKANELQDTEYFCQIH